MKRKIFVVVGICLLIAITAITYFNFSGGYTDEELQRVQSEISTIYMPSANNGRYAIASVGIGQITVNKVFGTAKEKRVVVQVMREYADEYRELFKKEYGNKVYVIVIDRPYQAS